MNNFHCLIMAGGGGTRFWPESYSKRPKQYLNLVGENSLLRETLLRFDGLIDNSRRYIVTVEAQKNLAQESGENEISNDGIIFEPSGRNTAPCILLSIASLINKGVSENDVIAIVPADHVILNKAGFQKTMKLAARTAEKDKKIVTIGINPNFPHTGYGYIEKAKEVDNEIFNVKAFKEKPTTEVAKQFVASGNYFWNAGMFVAPISVLLEEFEKHAPEIYVFYDQLKNAIGNHDTLAKIYSEIPANSIDYAIMEKSDNVMVIPAKFDWNDLGSWDALESVSKQVEENTVAACRGSYFKGSKGNIVFTPNKFVSLINVDNLIVVSNDRAVLVLPKDDSQKVKEVVEHLKNGTDFSDLL